MGYIFWLLDSWPSRNHIGSSQADSWIEQYLDRVFTLGFYKDNKRITWAILILCNELQVTLIQLDQESISYPGLASILFVFSSHPVELQVCALYHLVPLILFSVITSVVNHYSQPSHNLSAESWAHCLTWLKWVGIYSHLLSRRALSWKVRTGKKFTEHQYYSRHCQCPVCFLLHLPVCQYLHFFLFLRPLPFFSQKWEAMVKCPEINNPKQPSSNEY